MVYPIVTMGNTMGHTSHSIQTVMAIKIRGILIRFHKTLYIIMPLAGKVLTNRHGTMTITQSCRLKINR